MARIAGVDIPNNKRVEIALTYIYGIGRKSANDILAKTGINPDTRDLYIACTSFTKNEEYALKAIAWLSEQTQEERPAWLDSLESETGESAQDSLPEIG